MIFLKLFLPVILVALISTPCAYSESLKPYSDNNFYWEYKGKPILLLGGFHGAHNVFLDADVTESRSEPFSELVRQMDELKQVGGNVMRCVFNPGKGHNYGYPAWEEVGRGKFDAAQFTSGPNSYWGRFGRFLQEAQKRNIIVQLEVWDRFDWEGEYAWGLSAFNPTNNINYTESESGLAGRYSSYKENPFAESVPDHPKYKSATKTRKKKYDLVRHYQELYINKLLSISLKYDIVLYTMNNETHVDKAWGIYWMAFIKNAADKKGKNVYTTDMFDDGWKLQSSANYKYVFRNPSKYTFLDISQNTQFKVVGGPEAHWANILYARSKISSSIRPINNTKTYGAVQARITKHHFKVYERFGELAGQNGFWMNIIGGCASSRFHRPSGGLGLSSIAKASIKAARKLETKIKMWDVAPRNDLLSNRGVHNLYYIGYSFENEPFVYGEAYLAADPGKKYALYFTKGGSVNLDLIKYPNDIFELSWININTGNWGSSHRIEGGVKVAIAPPTNRAWVAAILSKN